MMQTIAACAQTGAAISPFPVAIRPLDELVVTEMVETEYCLLLAERIQAAGYWTDPIPVDRRSGLILDGNHRYHAARRLGLARLPCVEVDYGGAEVQVAHWTSGEPFCKEDL